MARLVRGGDGVLVGVGVAEGAQDLLVLRHAQRGAAPGVRLELLRVQGEGELAEGGDERGGTSDLIVSCWCRIVL